MIRESTVAPQPPSPEAGPRTPHSIMTRNSTSGQSSGHFRGPRPRERGSYPAKRVRNISRELQRSIKELQRSITLPPGEERAFLLYQYDGASLDDLREAMATLEETAPIARRVLGESHPVTMGIEGALRNVRAALRARDGSSVRPSEETVRAVPAMATSHA